MKEIAILFLIFIIVSCSVQNEKREIKQIQRYGSVVRVKPEKLEEYKKLHANPWPEVNAMIKDCNIQNYSIYYRDELLFSYFEYTGSDFEADMKKMAADSITQRWWKLTDPCQEPVESAKEGVWWAGMEEVYHLD